VNDATRERRILQAASQLARSGIHSREGGIRRSARPRTRLFSLAPRPEISGARLVKSMIRKLPSGKYRLYSRKKDPRTGRRKNLGTFASLEAAKAHERAVQYFKRH